MLYDKDSTDSNSRPTQKSYFVRAKHDKENPYVMVSKSMFRDKAISLKAKGLLGYLLCLPDSWKVNPKQVAEYLEIGREQVYSGVKELIEAGYCRVVQEKENGKFSNSNYEFSENPIFKKCLPCTGFPDTVVSDAEKPYLKNTELKITDVKEEKIKQKPPTPKGEESADAASISSVSSESKELAKFMVEELKNHNEKYEPKQTAPIAKELQDLSKSNTLQELKGVFLWAINHDFWAPHFYNKQKNVGKYFSQKYAHLYAAMKSEKKSKKSTTADNRGIARKYTELFESQFCELRISEDAIWFCPTVGANQTEKPLKFNEIDFENVLMNELKRRGFNKKI
jgi:hypothetical protein